MYKKKIMEILNDAMLEVNRLETLSPNNDEYPRWCQTTEGILYKVFGKDSIEYETFKNSERSWGVVQDAHTEYHRALKRRETALTSIIRTQEILGDEKPEERKVSPKSPINLFDSMKFHPKVVEASRGLFKDKYYSQAIFEAFKAVNNFVKEKSGLSPNEIRGMKDSQLMAKVFDVNNPIIKVNELLSDTDISEQEGFKFLFMGATVGIRNPKAHDFIKMKDPYKTLEYLAFASLLLKKISFWKVD